MVPDLYYFFFKVAKLFVHELKPRTHQNTMKLFGTRIKSDVHGDEPSSLRDSLLERGASSSGRQHSSFSIPVMLSGAPVIPGADSEGVQRRETCAEGAKTAARTFIVYAIVGLIGAILFKSMTKILAVAVILLFVVYLFLTGSGMIAVNWNNVGGAMLRTIDRDGDGRVGWNDFKAWFIDLVAFLSSRGIPAIGGLGIGIFSGFYFL